MENKESAKERFLGTFLGAVKDWDMHLAESVNSNVNANPIIKEAMQKMIEEQENHGNAIGLGREVWYSNDYFIHCQILDFISYVKGDQDLGDELKLIYVGKLGNPGLDAEAINMDMESEGYLIKISFEMELNLVLFSNFVSYHLFGMQREDKDQLIKLLLGALETFLLFIDKKELLKKTEEVHPADPKERDQTSIREHIASELFEASMKFLLSHEIGHHFLKHTESKGRNLVSKFIPTDVTSNQLHLDEFAADNFGFDLSIVQGKKENNKTFLLAPLVVILMLALFDKTPEEPSQTHPSLRDRYLNLLSRVTEVNEQIASENQHFFNFVASWINKLIPGYWKTEWWK
ncbi:hypothetical protein YDYSY3_39380 [Paenibacillus chitinolyticus]|uniref:hypothetical protein n=1 Tax=Paenibacillus chitinolyticus TaxID=79263 RepID=UPI0026E4AF87|nr:hypothetical protein [Paenibacillus chitinolyticus]GKS12938.1 hypothetical protein YDYSY3_39380 [Paenibacillus chitinolyticus]